MEIQINRWTKLGWEFSTNIGQNEKGWYIEIPEKPYYIGTYNQVSEMIRNDKTFNSIKSGGTYYVYNWFVKVNNKWIPIKEIFVNEYWHFEMQEYGTCNIILEDK